MIRFIWQNWWRHKERFILMLVGALIVSVGLSYLVGLSQANKGTIVNDLQKRWSASYDIIVRPPGSRSVTEKKKLFEPDYLSGLSGGISLDQYHQIQKIDGISVAAPISMIGYTRYEVALKEGLRMKKPGIYRVQMNFVTDEGPRKVKNQQKYYFAQGWKGTSVKSGITAFNGLTAGTSVLLAGIDPKEEAKLVGLNDAVLKSAQSRYFTTNDQVQSDPNGGFQIPILVNDREFVDETYHFTIQKLALPFQQPGQTISKVKEKGGEQYLDTVKGTTVNRFTFTSDQVHQLLVESMTGINPKTGKEVQTLKKVKDVTLLIDQPSPLQLRPVSSPFPKKWPFAYETKIQQNEEAPYQSMNKPTFRKEKCFGDTPADWIRLKLNYIGFYDPGKLKISKDPLTELPMETYRPASAKLVLDAKGNPVNPPIKMKPEDGAFGLLTRPPTMLTTIDAAAK
ncbi:MAG TPA: ABC transporter permease, partial [Bacillales bacterium]|nr:ABC transporter permease [Bacillales bacterium]